MKKILAIDLGKFKSVACVYSSDGSTPRFETIPTRPTVFQDLFVMHQPDRVVIEIAGRPGVATSRPVMGGMGRCVALGSVPAKPDALLRHLASP